MGKRDDLIAQYADDLKNKCGMSPDMDLLRKVTIACGPAIYNADASTVAGSQPAELETVKNNFLMKSWAFQIARNLWKLLIRLWKPMAVPSATNTALWFIIC